MTATANRELADLIRRKMTEYPTLTNAECRVLVEIDRLRTPTAPGRTRPQAHRQADEPTAVGEHQGY